MDVFWDLFKAFVVGGLICVVGQVLIQTTKLTNARILVLFVTAGVFLTALGVYKPLVDFAGAGATVPLTGFGYSLAMGAIIAALSFCDDFHKEMDASDRLRTQIKEYVDEAERAKAEAARLQKENEHLRAGMDALCADILDLKKRLESLGQPVPQCSIDFDKLSRHQAVKANVQQRQQTAAAPPKPEKPEKPAPEKPPHKEEPKEEPKKEKEPAAPAKEPAEPKPEPPKPTAQAPSDPGPDAKEKEEQKPAPAYAPLRRPNPDYQDVQPVQTGSYTRPKSPFEPDLPSSEGFVSFFEKKEHP